MTAIRTALLLVAVLTCSAQAAEIVNFSADHVTIKGRIIVGSKISAMDKTNEVAQALDTAEKLCGAYGKYPHEIIREQTGSTGHREYVATLYIHYACLKEQPRP